MHSFLHESLFGASVGRGDPREAHSAVVCGAPVKTNLYVAGFNLSSGNFSDETQQQDCQDIGRPPV